MLTFVVTAVAVTFGRFRDYVLFSAGGICCWCLTTRRIALAFRRAWFADHSTVNILEQIRGVARVVDWSVGYEQFIGDDGGITAYTLHAVGADEM
jgi:hypothetical protein